MPAFVDVQWDVDWARMYAVPEQTFAPSAEATKEVALKMRHERKHSGVGMSIQGTHAEMVPTGTLGRIFEYGRRGGEPIDPTKKRALAGARFGPVASSVEGPMRPYPYVRPAAAWWASGGYNEVARGVMAAEGLGL